MAPWNCTMGWHPCVTVPRRWPTAQGEFRAETADMDSQIDEEIDSLLDSIGGNMDDPVSFVSKKNTHVDSVQFVIQTEGYRDRTDGLSTSSRKKRNPPWERS